MTKKNLPVPLKELITLGKAFNDRNWVMGAAGNFSAVICRRPFEWAITKSGVHRGSLTDSDFISLNKYGQPLSKHGVPSVESPIHWAIISNTGAGAVLQTHSVWSMILSDAYSQSGGLELEGFEVLKGLSGVKSAHPLEWVAILESSDDYMALSRTIARLLKRRPGAHAILLRKRGLYAWGSTVQEAARHVETFELLFEVIVRQLHIFSHLEMGKASSPYS